MLRHCQKFPPRLQDGPATGQDNFLKKWGEKLLCRSKLQPGDRGVRICEETTLQPGSSVKEGEVFQVLEERFSAAYGEEHGGVQWS